MSNLKRVLNNIRLGDILLSRKRKDTLMIMDRNILRPNWSYAFMYIGDGIFIQYINGQLYWFRDAWFLKEDEWDLGLFRVTPHLSETEEKILLNIAKSISNKCCYELGLSIDTSQLIAATYSSLGIELNKYPIWQTTPIDFDESSVTVRIV